MNDRIDIPAILFLLLLFGVAALGYFVGLEKGRENCIYGSVNGSNGSNGSNVSNGSTATNGSNGSTATNGNGSYDDELIIYGCTDPTAINYYAGAGSDDGSCIYNI
jgi:hypothetical protein